MQLMKFKYIQQYNYCDQKGVITVDFTFDRSLTKFDFPSLYLNFKLDIIIPIIYLLFVWCLIIHVFLKYFYDMGIVITY